MRIKNKLATGAVIAGVLIPLVSAQAQFFDSGNMTSQHKEETLQQQDIATQNTKPAAEQNKATQTEQPARQQRQVTPFEYGGQQFSNQAKTTAAATTNTNNRPMITFSSNKRKEDHELIMMYMKDFNVYRSPSGQTRCSVQFAIVTTLPVKLSNISYRLQWPKMDTVLSFNDVQPQVENHFNYSLLGDGCYTMDRTPNIVINRCRVKGMSQRACASKVRWITRAY